MPPAHRLSKARFLSSTFALPPRQKAHDIIKYQMFEWSLLPEIPPDQKRIVTKCTLCTKKYFFGFERNWTTLKQHYESVHNLTMERVKMEAAKSPAPDEWSILGSSLIGANGVYEESYTVNDHVANDGPNASSLRIPGRKRGPFIYAPLDKAEYERLMLMMIVKNDLPFSLVESESFRNLLCFLRDDAPPMDRSMLRGKLEELYENELEKLKKRLDENTGKFSITVDQWRSGSNIDFLKITLHFYNNEYILENHTIGFEAMNGNIKYTGELLYDFMLEALGKHGIEKRIMSVTRANSGPMDDMMNKFKQKLSVHEIGFDGDIRCLGHVLNVSTEILLRYTYFKGNGIEKFEKSTETVPAETPYFQEFAHRMKQLPRIMRLIILQINHSHKMKNKFKALVEAKRARESSNAGLKKPFRDSDTHWLSTYHMIDRFIHFREEITTVLMLNYGSFSDSTADLEKFQLTTKDWDYLKSVRDILDVFRAPVSKLQRSSYPTINLTIPMIHGVLTKLKSLKYSDDQRANPLIAFGLEEARNKLLEYYPLHDKTITSNKMLYLAVVLDPRCKLAVFKRAGFSAEKIRAIEDLFFTVFHEYKSAFKHVLETDPVDPGLPCPKEFDEENEDDDDTGFWYVDEKPNTDGDEFGKYLREPRESGSQDVIAFYKTHKSEYPIISRMARDYFAVTAISAPSEPVFSRVANMATTRKGRHLTRSIKMLAILKTRGIIKSEEMPDENMDREWGEKLEYPEFIEVKEEVDETGLVIDDDYAEEDDGDKEAGGNIFNV